MTKLSSVHFQNSCKTSADYDYPHSITILLPGIIEMADDSLDALDYVAWGVYALSFGLYHLYLLVSVKRHNFNVSLSVMLVNNPAWTAKMVRTKGSELLAVQCK